MVQKVSNPKLSDSIEPLCPRDSHVMHYDTKSFGVAGKSDTREASYLCGYQGCSVRYTPFDGYFSIIETPDLPEAVEEPGVNLLRCPRHGGWLYRSVAENAGDHLIWRCGVEGCDHMRADYGPAWPSL